VLSPEIVGVSGASTTSMRKVPGGEGATVDLGDRLVRELESGDRRVVPEMCVVVELPVECRVEQAPSETDEEAKGVSEDGE
jgi:hypothetical protein